MTMETILWAVALVLAYPLILWRLNGFVEPDRMRLAETGERLLQRSDLSREDRNMVEWMMGNAFNGWIAVAAVFAFPLAAVLMLLSGAWRERFLSRSSARSMEVKNEMAMIRRLFFISIFAANPLFGIAVITERLMISAVIAIFGNTRDALRELDQEVLRLEFQKLAHR
jgi:hypothetical protein